MGKRIVFTGGSGKAGKHVVPYLLSRGYEVLNLDLRPLEHPGVHTLITDVADGGQVFNALTSHLNMAGFEKAGGRRPPDAVVHFAALARNMIQPDAETFRVNVMSTYHVIEAATTLGVRKIVIASSETTYGVCFADGDKDYACFPLEEDYAVDPMDSYGLSKVVNERTADAFALRTGADIYALRIGNIIEPHEYERFPGFLADPKSRKRNAWSYVDARDLGQIVRLAIETDGLGFQVFNAVNDTITAELPTAEFLAKYSPGVPIKRPLAGYEAPICNRKIREVLGFREEHDWRKYVKR
jgi:nucleoside-diphosphate-sugar epimerase